MTLINEFIVIIIDNIESCLVQTRQRYGVFTANVILTL